MTGSILRLPVLSLSILSALAMEGCKSEGSDCKALQRQLGGGWSQPAQAQYCDLTGLRMYRADLTLANLKGANLQGADLDNVKLAGADLTGANLSGADLRTADLRDAKLADADLTGTRLGNAPGADFLGAITHGLAEARDLSDANLSGVDLSGVNLSNVSLERAKLQDAKLVGTRMEHTLLKDSNLSGADLSGSVLIGAKMTGARISGANFSGVIWTAGADGPETICPDGMVIDGGDKATCAGHGPCTEADGNCSGVSSADCAVMQGCFDSGRCTARNGICDVGGDSDCQGSQSCKLFGKCRADSVFGLSRTEEREQLAISLRSPLSECIAGSELDCEKSSACVKRGWCLHRDRECVEGGRPAVYPCSKREDCTVFGQCTERDGQCIAGSDTDCQQSQFCRDNRRCTASGGRCVDGSDSPTITKESDREPTNGDANVPQSPRSVEVPPHGDREAAQRLNKQALGFHKRGRMDAALQSYMRAVEADPSYEWSRYNLACALGASGNVEGALHQLSVIQVIGTDEASKALRAAWEDDELRAVRLDVRFAGIATPR